ncbi:hypothetical protein AGDE_16383 [Angomonas deanei]|nr:hypothetical protein AGDE_16383 [Angomonas deanei]|eukprot:EPY17164.1 hypothetical protein AGDE_16383 [Angomonas deanei]
MLLSFSCLCIAFVLGQSYRRRIVVLQFPVIMSEKSFEPKLCANDRPDPVSALPTYGGVSQGTALRPVVLPDGRTAYVPVMDSTSHYSPYGRNQYTAALDTAPEPNAPPADLSRVLYYYNSGRPSTCCLLSSRAVVLTLNCLAFIFSILSIAAPFVQGAPSTYCGSPYDYYDSCYNYVEYVFAFGGESILAWIGAITMATGFALYIPTLVLSAIFLHIGRQYPERERREAANEALPLADRRRRALTRIYYDVNITKALFATTLVSVCLCIAVTVLYFLGWSGAYDDGSQLVGAPIPVVAGVLYLTALILTPIRAATNTSLELPAEARSSNDGEGCCYFIHSEG